MTIPTIHPSNLNLTLPSLTPIYVRGWYDQIPDRTKTSQRTAMGGYLPTQGGTALGGAVVSRPGRRRPLRRHRPAVITAAGGDADRCQIMSTAGACRR